MIIILLCRSLICLGSRYPCELCCNLSVGRYFQLFCFVSVRALKAVIDLKGPDQPPLGCSPTPSTQGSVSAQPWAFSPQEAVGMSLSRPVRGLPVQPLPVSLNASPQAAVLACPQPSLVTTNPPGNLWVGPSSRAWAEAKPCQLQCHAQLLAALLQGAVSPCCALALLESKSLALVIGQSCGVSIHGDGQNPSSRGLEHPAAAHPALSRGLW